MQVKPQSLGGYNDERHLTPIWKQPQSVMEHPMSFSEPRHLSTEAKPDPGWFFLGVAVWCFQKSLLTLGDWRRSAVTMG